MGARLTRTGGWLLSVLLSPFRLLGRGLRRTAAAFWSYLGLLGLALRNLLTWVLWRPFLLLTLPFRFIFRKALARPLTFLWRKVTSLSRWLYLDLVKPAFLAAPGTVHQIIVLVIESLDYLGFWSRRYSGRASIRTGKAIRALKARITGSPLRLNRLAIALTITLIIIALGVIPNQEVEPEESLAPHRALAEQNPSPTPVPTRIEIPSPTPPITALEAPSETVSQLPTPAPTEIPKAPEPLPGSIGTVIFSMHRNGNSDLYAVVEGGKAPFRLTSHPASDLDPAWSPGGDRIAFSSHRDGNWDIYVLDLLSGEIDRITSSPAYEGSPSWSPDGRWLVFESYQFGNLDLFIVSADTETDPIRITEHPMDDYSPEWGPGGRHIAFTSRREGEPDIFILPLDATTDDVVVNLTNSPEFSEDNPSLDQSGGYLAFERKEAGLNLTYVQPLVEHEAKGDPLLIRQGSDPVWIGEEGSLLLIHRQDDSSFVLGGTVSPWNPVSQAFAVEDPIDDLSWSKYSLPVDLNITRHPAADIPLFREQKSPVREEGAPYLIWPVDVDAPSAYLSDRVDQSFEALRARLIEEAGWDFLGRVDNMFTALAVRPSPGEDFKNWNKAGRAFDFYHRFPLSLDPQVEIVREDIGSETFWRVFLRAANQDGTQGRPLQERPWDFTARYGSEPRYYDLGGKQKDEIPGGYYVDFTSLAADYSWQRVPSSPDWRTFFQDIRYWHFENRQGLSWEEAILELYTENELATAVGSP